MIKVLCFLKRREGLSVDAFRDYYELHHSKLGEQSLGAAGAVKYVRRYINNLPDRYTPRESDCGFDVVTEIWFDDTERFQRWFAGTRDPVLMDRIVEDEARLFDRDRTYFTTVEERESSLG
jgi:hypothetical protein